MTYYWSAAKEVADMKDLSRLVKIDLSSLRYVDIFCLQMCLQLVQNMLKNVKILIGERVLSMF